MTRKLTFECPDCDETEEFTDAQIDSGPVIFCGSCGRGFNVAGCKANGFIYSSDGEDKGKEGVVL